MEIDRRIFLKILAGASGFGALGGLSGCTTFESPRNSQAVATNENVKGKLALILAPERNLGNHTMRILNWDDYRYEDAALGKTIPHSLVRNKNNHDEYFVFGLFDSIDKINLSNGKKTSVPPGPKSSLSYGHGVQTRNGEYLLCTEITKDPLVSLVTIRSADNLELVGKLPEQIGSHHLVHLPDSSVVVSGFAMGPHPSHLYFFDYERREIVREIPFDLAVAHLGVESATQVLGVGTRARMAKNSPFFEKLSFESSNGLNEYNHIQSLIPEPAPIFQAALDGSYQFFWDEKRKDIFKSGFGITDVPSKGVWISSFGIASNSVVVWKDAKVFKILPVTDPSSIAVSKDASEFMVLSAGRLKTFSLETFEELKSPHYDRPIVSIAAYS